MKRGKDGIWRTVGGIEVKGFKPTSEVAKMSRQSELRKAKILIAQAARDGINDYMHKFKSDQLRGAAVCCLDDEDESENNTVQFNGYVNGEHVTFEFTVRELFGSNM